MIQRYYYTAAEEADPQEVHISQHNTRIWEEVSMEPDYWSPRIDSEPMGWHS